MQRLNLKNILFWLAIGALITPFLINIRTYFPFIITKATVFRVIVELMLVIWVFWLIKEKKTLPKLTPLTKAVLIYGLVIFISALLGINFMWSFFSGNERMEGVFGIWHFILFFIILATTFDWREIERILKIQVFISLFYSFIALLAYFGVGSITAQMTSNRLAGYTGNPSYFATYLMFNAFFALYFYFQQYRLDKKIFNYWFIIFVIQSLLMFVTGTRGVMMGYFLAMVVIFLGIIFWLKEKSYYSLKKASLIICLIGALSMVGIFTLKNTVFVKNNFALERLTSISLKDPTAVSRLMSAKTALRAFLEKPLFGWGPENYQTAYIKYFNPLVIKYLPSDFFFDRAHNKPMEVLATTGVFGFISYLAIFGTAFWLLFKNQKRNHEWLLPSLALVGLVIGYFIQNVFIFDFHESYLMFFLALVFIASLTGCHPRENGDFRDSRLRGNDKEEHKKDFSREMANYFVLITVICLVIYSLSFWVIKPYVVSHRIFIVFRDITQGQGGAALSDSQRVFNSPSFFREDAVIGIGKIFAPNASKLDVASRQKINTLLLTEAKQILEKYPERYLLLLSRAELEVISSEWNKDGLKEAQTTIQKAIALTPAFPQPRIFYTKLLLLDNNYDEALKQVQTILSLNSDIPEAQYYLSVIYQKQGKTEQSLEALMRAVELSVQIKNKNLILTIVQQLAPLKRYDLIERLYLQALNLDPKDANFYVYLAINYGKMHNKDKAIEYAQKAAELNPDLKQASEDFIQLIEKGEWDKIPD